MNPINGADLVAPPHALNAGGSSCVVSYGDLRFFVGNGTGKGCWCNTNSANRLSGRHHFPDQSFNIRLHRSIRTFEGKIAQVFSRPKSAGKDQSVQFRGAYLGDIPNVSPRNPRRFNQNISLFRRFLIGQVIDYMELVHIGSHTQRLCPSPVQKQQRQDRLMNLGSIKNPTSR